MGLFSFIKEAGEKLFGGKEAAPAPGANVADLNAKAGDAIKTYIEQQNLGLSGLGVAFDGGSGTVTLSAISKKYYGDANKYNVIFEANKPMLSDPNKIYPGQKLRIPAL